jgi:RNA polymerase sigma-70 factor (ECF subfamily)
MGNEIGLTSVYQKMRRRLASAVRSLVGPSDVEDILQEAFLRCYEASSTRRVEHPSSYLLRTAVNLAINHTTRADQRLNTSFDDSAEELNPDGSVDIERQAIQRERLALYCRAVAELPLQCRRAFLLKKVYGLSQREIATYLKISENTVEKHVAKGLLHCATRIRETESDSGTARRRSLSGHHG